MNNLAYSKHIYNTHNLQAALYNHDHVEITATFFKDNTLIYHNTPSITISYIMRNK